MEIEVIAGGAAPVWNLVPNHLDGSYLIVDWYHGTEHLAGTTRFLFDEGSPAARRWLKAQHMVLYQGPADEIAATLRTRAEYRPSAGEDLRVEAGYSEKTRSTRIAWKKHVKKVGRLGVAWWEAVANGIRLAFELQGYLGAVEGLKISCQ